MTTPEDRRWSLQPPPPDPDIDALLLGMEMLPGEGRLWVDVWRSWTSRHSIYITRQVARVAGEAKQLAATWTSHHGRISRLRWEVTILFAVNRRCHRDDVPSRYHPIAIRAAISSGDDSGWDLLPPLGDDLLIGQGLRERLITDGIAALAEEESTKGHYIDLGPGGEPFPAYEPKLSTACRAGANALTALPFEQEPWPPWPSSLYATLLKSDWASNDQAYRRWRGLPIKPEAPSNRSTTSPLLPEEQLDIPSIAKMLGSTVKTIQKYRSTGRLPTEDGTLGSSPWWWKSTITTWNRKRPKHRHDRLDENHHE